MPLVDITRFNFIAEALHGGGGFRPVVSGDPPSLRGKSHLIQYPREGDDKFARRNEVAWYANDLMAASKRFAGYLAKKSPQRDVGGGELLKAFLKDCDWRGNALDVFWSGFTIEAKARGCMLLLVDMPRQSVDDQGEQIAQRVFPYLVPIPPERIDEYETDERGRIAKVEIHDGDVIRGWNTTQWWVRKGDRDIEREDHGLGRCPILAFSESGNFPDEGEFAQIADLAKRLFNLHSELDEILRAQTFSLLTYQVPPESMSQVDTGKVASEVSTHNMLIHTGDSPGFIAPPDGPARIYMERIAQMEEKIRRIGHVVEAPEKTESGIALTIRFQQLNSALSDWAGRMEDLERRVWDLFHLWLGNKQHSTEVNWDDDYAIADVAAELETLGGYQTGGFSDETLQAKRKQIIGLDFASFSEDKMAELLASEDEGSHERAGE